MQNIENFKTMKKDNIDMKKVIFSSPEPSGSQGELIVYPCSGLRRCHRLSVNNVQTSSLKPLGQSKTNFIWSLLGKGEKVYINGQGHMAKMAATPIYGKNLLQNQKSYHDLETWHVASGTQGLQSLYK